MNVLIALNGFNDLNLKKLIKKNKINYIIGVDGGSNHLYKEMITPSLLIGDFDSIDQKAKDFYQDILKNKIIKLNTEKDETDYQYILNYLQKNFNDIENIFVIGYKNNKRIDHFLANLNLINEKIIYISSDECIFLLTSGEHQLKRAHVNKKYISFFAKKEATKISLSGFKYNLVDYNLKFGDNLCISNELKSDTGFIEIEKGELLVFISDE